MDMMNGTCFAFPFGRMTILPDLKQSLGYSVGDRIKIKDERFWSGLSTNPPPEAAIGTVIGFANAPGNLLYVVVKFGDQYFHNLTCFHCRHIAFSRRDWYYEYDSNHSYVAHARDWPP